MEDYKVTITNDLTIIETVDNGFKMRIFKDNAGTYKGSTAFLEATLYKETTSYIPCCSYIFEALTKDDQLILENVDVALFKSAVDFFFNSLLGTDLYVKSVPHASTLSPFRICQTKAA